MGRLGRLSFFGLILGARILLFSLGCLVTHYGRLGHPQTHDPPTSGTCFMGKSEEVVASPGTGFGDGWKPLCES